MIPEKVNVWIRFPARISVVYHKPFPINDLVFKCLLKHMHIRYEFSYRILDLEICSAVLMQIFSIFFILLC